MPGATGPVHGTEQELPLIEQLLVPRCSIFSQFQDLSVKRNIGQGELGRYHHISKKMKKGSWNLTWSKWIPLTRAALATTGFLSTMACFKYLSIWVRSVPSVIRQRTRIAFARYISVLLFMSFIRELVTIITFLRQWNHMLIFIHGRSETLQVKTKKSVGI